MSFGIACLCSDIPENLEVVETTLGKLWRLVSRPKTSMSSRGSSIGYWVIPSSWRDSGSWHGTTSAPLLTGTWSPDNMTVSTGACSSDRRSLARHVQSYVVLDQGDATVVAVREARVVQGTRLFRARQFRPIHSPHPVTHWIQPVAVVLEQPSQHFLRERDIRKARRRQSDIKTVRRIHEAASPHPGQRIQDFLLPSSRCEGRRALASTRTTQRDPRDPPQAREHSEDAAVSQDRQHPWLLDGNSVRCRRFRRQMRDDDSEKLEEGFRQTGEWGKSASLRFGSHPMIQITYEELVSNPRAIFARLVAFLNAPSGTSHESAATES